MQNKPKFPGAAGLGMTKQNAYAAIRSMGILPETLAYAVGAAPNTVALANGEWTDGVARAEKLINEPRESETTVGISADSDVDSIVTQLGSVLAYAEAYIKGEREHDDEHLNAVLVRLHNVSKLSIEQIAAFAGVGADTIYDFAENASSVSAEDKYHLAVTLSKLNNILNYPQSRAIIADMFVPNPSLPKGLTSDEMFSAAEAIHKPIQRPCKE